MSTNTQFSMSIYTHMPFDVFRVVKFDLFLKILLPA